MPDDSKKPNVHAPGSLILFTRGEYSDFRTDAAVKTEREIDFVVEARAFYAALPKDEDGDVDPSGGDARDAFIAHLIETGAVTPLDLAEVHLGSYGNFTIDDVDVTRPAFEWETR
jgi:hypothetical protein